MQLVLTNRYTEQRMGPGWITRFYLARYFRLYPVYIAMTLVVVAVAAFWTAYPAVPVWTTVSALPDTIGNICFRIFLRLSNATIFFQDVTMFLSLNGDNIVWSANYRYTDAPLWLGLAVPQAWSLGIELSFYMIAPYVLNMRSRWVVVYIISSLLVKVTVIKVFQLGDPWTYRFFPFELGYFFMGAMAFRYRLLLDRCVSRYIPENIAIYCVYIFVVMIATCRLQMGLSNTLYPPMLVCALPFIFRITAKMKFDRLIGELSYPFYIVHMFAITLARAVISGLSPLTDNLAGWAALGLSFLMAGAGLALEIYVVEPWRGRLAQTGFAATPK